MNANILSIIGFKPTSSYYGEGTFAMKFKGYAIAYHNDLFHLFFKKEYSHGFTFGDSGYDDCENKRAKRTFLLCKALNEIEKKDYGMDGYKDNIQWMLIHMFFAKSTRIPDDRFTDASGTQQDIAERYYKLIRKGEWW